VTDDKQLQAPEKEPIKVSFSVPQLAGGALAAATAALIGSRLGVAGTILGAAVASIVGGVGGTLYSAGIDRTHRKVTEAIQRGYERVRGDEVDAPDATRTLATDGGNTLVLGEAETDTDVMDTIFRTPGESTRIAPAPVPAPVVASSSQGRSTRFWQVAALSVGAMFLVALSVITVVELGLGRTLDGRDGTTVSQAVRPSASASAKPTATPTAEATTTSPTPSATATGTATSTPTPSATATGTTSSTPTPSATATATATATEQTTAASGTGVTS